MQPVKIRGVECSAENHIPRSSNQDPNPSPPALVQATHGPQGCQINQLPSASQAGGQVRGRARAARDALRTCCRASRGVFRPELRPKGQAGNGERAPASWRERGDSLRMAHSQLHETGVSELIHFLSEPPSPQTWAHEACSSGLDEMAQGALPRAWQAGGARHGSVSGSGHPPPGAPIRACVSVIHMCPCSRVLCRYASV